MNKKIKIFVIIFSILVFWLGGVPFIFSKAVPVLCENISFNSPYNVAIKKPKLILNIIPSAILNAEEIKIVANDESEKYYITNPKIKIRLFPLLSGKIHIDTISADNIDINSVLRDKLILEKDFFINVRKLPFQCDSVNLKKFVLKIKQGNVDGSILYSGTDLYYKKNGRYIKFNIDSNIELNGQKSDIKAKLYLPENNNLIKSLIDIDVKNVDIALLKEYLKYYLPNDLESMYGKVDVSADKNHLTLSLLDAAFNMKDSAQSIVFPKKFVINSDFNLTAKTLTILNSEITGDGVNANLSGTISNYIGKSLPSLNLNVRLNKSKAENIAKILPAHELEDINIYKLKKYKFYGDAIGNFSIKGCVKEPELYGNVFINNAILIKPIPKVPGATIKLSFQGKYLNYDVVVPAGKAEKVWVKGGVELYNVKYADMRVWSTKNVDLATVEEKIIPIHEILNFIIGPVPIMNIQGEGNIDIQVKGNRQNPHVWGNFNVKNTTAYFNEIPDLILKNADANLSFDGDNALFILNKGFINDKELSLKGTCSLLGKFDFDVISEKQELKYLYNAIKTSTMLDDVKNIIPKLDLVEGLANLKLKVYGNVKNIEDLKINQNCFYKGSLDFLGNHIVISNISIRNIAGPLLFDGLNTESKINANIGQAPLKAELILKNKIADLNLNVQRLNFADIIKVKDISQKNMADILADISLKYKGDANNIEYNKIDFTSNILGSAKNNTLQVSNGNVILKGGKLNIKNVNGYFLDTDSKFNIDLVTDNVTKNNVYNGSINLKNFELSLINIFSECTLIPENWRKLIKDFKFEKGKINLNSTIKNNNLNASTDLGGIELTYIPLDLPIKIINGSLYTRKNFLGLNKINLLADGMPILVDGGINDVFNKQDLNIYINSKPKQVFIDKYINTNRIYPIKIKGDIVYWAKIKGTKDNLNIQSEVTIAPDASFYYLGAVVGDIENAIVLNLDINLLKQNIVKIKEFSYDKIISSLSKRKTRLNMLKAKGGVNIYENDLVFDELKIKTSNPTDARIFNMIFRKPNIKQGQFTSDLKINGKLSNPNVLGTFHIFETNIPFLDTTMKNISFVFGERNIDLTSSGEIMGNDIKFKGTIKNKLNRPYYVENAELYTKVIDLNYLTNKLKMSQVDDYQGFSSLENFSLSDIVIRNIKMNANGIKLRNLTAENVEANVSINEKQQLEISNFKFNIADGNLAGNFKYNVQNGHTQFNLRAKDINANDITYAIFDLNNQIYGDLTGDITLSCVGSDFNKCLETLNGKTTFNVSDGKMPKLGSLEYLLKAGNLVKGGVTGISINSIIDIITPLKTGDFSNITGNINIKDGVAENVEILTRGKDLSLFITGNYNFADSVAEMEVFGLLSKKISTMFGPLGNISLNTLFNIIPGVDLTKDSKILENINKIPGIEFSEKSFRKFIAEIKGNINGDNYVKSFKWIN